MNIAATAIAAVFGLSLSAVGGAASLTPEPVMALAASAELMPAECLSGGFTYTAKDGRVYSCDANDAPVLCKERGDVYRDPVGAEHRCQNGLAAWEDQDGAIGVVVYVGLAVLATGGAAVALGSGSPASP